MTALRKYQRLESSGLWRETPAEQRREVLVLLRDATLVLADPRTEIALAHWSLPAVHRLNGSGMPALFAPDTTGDETLEIDDATMISALQTVQMAVERARPHPGRLRSGLLAGGAVFALALALLWLPGQIIRHTAAVLPPAAQADLGAMALADLGRLTGAPCHTPLGQRALDLLSARLGLDGQTRLAILRDGLTRPAHLPGPVLLLPARLLADPNASPEALAGYVLAELAQTQRTPDAPDAEVRDMLSHAGLLATIRLLSTGQMPATALRGYGEVFLATARGRTDAPVSQWGDAQVADLLARFQTAQVAASPYAYALDPSGEQTLALIEADPFRGISPDPLLTPDDWAALRRICGQP